MYKHHQKWLAGWSYGVLLGELQEAKVAGCDFCIRELKKKLTKEISRINNYE